MSRIDVKVNATMAIGPDIIVSAELESVRHEPIVSMSMIGHDRPMFVNLSQFDAWHVLVALGVDESIATRIMTRLSNDSYRLVRHGSSASLSSARVSSVRFAGI